MRASLIAALIVAATYALLPPALAGCGECGCSAQLDRCLKQAGPGASTSDCYVANDECVRMCRAPRIDDGDGGR
ncbi:MAG: hypothetical protein KC657_35165 [Myxococcales bacterium]|nr:hypothetical protein [Myxococcales bacterium]